MKPLLIGITLAAAAATPQNALQPGALPGGASAPHPALYSFVDVYRLTVGGPVGGLPLEPRFLVAPAPQPDTWLMVLAGLALAGWVAHRRLVRSL